MFKLNFRNTPKGQGDRQIKTIPQTQIKVIQPHLLHRFQNRLPLENTIQQRIIIPKNRIDLYNNLNTIESTKTIWHVLDCSNGNGFGDYLRGSILLSQYAKYFNVNLKLNVSRHKISKYLNIESEKLTETNIHSVCFNSNEDNDKVLYSLIQEFINSNEDNIYITTNLYYNMNLVSNDSKDYINSFFTFKEHYFNLKNQLFNLDKYEVLHIRCKDEHFNTDFEDNYLLSEIIKLQLTCNTVIISNNYSLKRKINKLFGFHFIDKDAYHTAKIKGGGELELTIIEYIILSRSQHTYCFSYYHHGSGFSEQCSVLNNIPYNVIYLHDTHIVSNNILLLNYYNNIVENDCIQLTHETLIKQKYDDIAFITLTNTGYIDYTLNCLQSLNNINMEITLKSYCIGKKGYDILYKMGYLCELIDDNEASDFQEFRKSNWSNITYYKFEIIYKNLLKNKYVCITDGDIIYENVNVFDYLLKNIKNNDLLIQSEGIYNLDICSGFMFIQSNYTTLSIFNPDNVKQYRYIEGWDDQIYINANKYKLNYKKLPLQLFPTGLYYYDYNQKINPYLIHFNWVIGNEKKNIMMKYNKWYSKIKICQYGTDGFGHQLEGLLRLLSLCLNNKAEYVCYDKKYSFEHNNFDVNKLTQYLNESIKNTLIPKYRNDLNIIFKEQRTFDEILKHDIDIDKTIYCYDGVSSNIPNVLPPNFENNNDIVKSLPKLRKAFVENIYLPSPSYDNKLINVCCHIRLGDAIGNRVLDNENIFIVIREFQKYDKYRIIIHSDGNVNHLQNKNTIIHDSNTDVLQVLSDFIFSDILIINYSSLSIAAHLLSDDKQIVICPTKAGPTFQQRILSKCITTKEFFITYVDKN